MVVRSLPEFPAIEYDETVQIATETSVQAIVDALTGTDPLLESVAVKDVYAKELPASSYSVTFHFVYRSSEGTLAEKDVQPVHTNVMEKLSSLVG